MSDERGAMSAMIGLMMVVLLGAAGIAVDLGHMMNVRTESQRVADATALAAAAAFVQAPGGNVVETARSWGMALAARNTIDRSAAVVLPGDIQLDVAARRVEVTVYNTADRGTAIPTVFARVLGIVGVDVVTRASAQAWPAAGVPCVLPLFVVDKWDERGGDPMYYDPGIDYYEPFVADTPTPTYTGYDQGDIGMPLLLKPAQGSVRSSGRPNASWYYPFDGAHIPGGANYRAAIQNCASDFVYTIGQQLWVEPGAMIGPTAQGFQNLIDQDPTAAWNQGLQCVVDASNLGSGDGSHCRSSPRLRAAPMFDPRTTPASGKKSVKTENFTGVFVDRLVGNDVWVILAGYTGVGPVGGPQPGATPPMLQMLRLVG